MRQSYRLVIECSLMRFPMPQYLVQDFHINMFYAEIKTSVGKDLTENLQMPIKQGLNSLFMIEKIGYNKMVHNQKGHL